MVRPVSDVTIRQAREDEVDAVLAMYEWLFAPPGSRPPSWEPERARAAPGQEVSTVLVAQAADGMLVGLISAYVDLNSVRFGLRCWVEDLAVDPAVRSGGVGKALLDGAKDWARDRGATHLELDTALVRADAQRFYERELPAWKSYCYAWELA